ncbi:MAG: metallophosphoesterase [Actinomycetota bacterium]|nr:metallophosphoesterase [Actinomycetota bacterium]
MNDADARDESEALARLRRRVRRLRLALAGAGIVALLCVLAVVGVLVYWHLYLLEPEGTPFTRGPFLIRLSTSGAEFAWTLRKRADVSLRAVAPSGRAVAANGARFSGLEPGTRYAWTASVGGRARAAGSFTTAPSDLRAPIRFAVIGDYGSGNDHEWAVARVLAAQQPSFILSAGDNSYLFALPSLLDRNIFRPLHDAMANAPLWATLGEHDLFVDGGNTIISALHLPGGGKHYSVRYGPIQIVALGLQADAKALAYARSALAEPGPSVRFILVHRPIRAGNPILPLLRSHHVAAILAGHLHRYERQVVAGVLEFTTGTSGEGPGDPGHTRPTPGAAISLLDYGLLRADVTADGITYAFVGEQGRVLDRFRGAPAP